jgi:type IV pilus assembly protein PilC
MPTFTYLAESIDGTPTDGRIDAETTVAARVALAEQGLLVRDLKERRGFLQFELTTRKIPREDVMNLSRQLAAFVRAGVPILEALATLGEDAHDPLLKQILAEVHAGLRAGEPLSTAVGHHQKAFPPFYVDMLRAAEMTGHLDLVLEQVARYIERDLDARRRIRSALAYPLIVLLASLGTVAILTVFVLPKFKVFFEQLDTELPLPTRMLLNITDILGKTWWMGLLAIVVFMLTLLRMRRTAGGRRRLDATILRLPIVGGVARTAIVERCCRVLASMVRAGVPLPDALRIVAEASNNRVYEEALTEVRDATLRGEGIAGPVAETGLFPRSIVQMIRVGEETGTLDEQLQVSADFYDRELDHRIKKLTTLFEPAVIVGMGLVVGFVAVALISAMYGIFNGANGA